MTDPASTLPAPPATTAEGHGYAHPAEVAGQPIGELVYLLLLAVTAAADFAVFSELVSIIMPHVRATLAYLAVAGFTAAMLALAHFAGRLLRDRKARYGPPATAALVVLLTALAVLGVVAFAVRLLVAPSAGDGTVSAAGGATGLFSNAFLFLALYVASAAVACFGEYLTRNPLRVRYRTALRAHRRALKRLAKSQPRYERALSVLQIHTRGRIREEQNYRAAAKLRHAHADELKRYAAFLMAAQLQDPSATDGMTLPDRLPFPMPPATPDHKENQ